MSDAVKVLARRIADRPQYWPLYTDEARALLAEITPLLVAEAVKVERERIVGVINAHRYPDGMLDMYADDLIAVIRARGGEG